MEGRSRVWTSKLNYKAWHLLVELGEGASHTALLVSFIRSGKYTTMITERLLLQRN